MVRRWPTDNAVKAWGVVCGAPRHQALIVHRLRPVLLREAQHAQACAHVARRLADARVRGFGRCSGDPHPRRQWQQQGSSDLGQVELAYLRVGTAHYADGIGKPVAGPTPRYVSQPHLQRHQPERVLRARGHPVGHSSWGQFLDHTFGLRAGAGGDHAPNIPFNATDPLESFTNDLGVIPFTRSAAAPGTGSAQRAPADQHRQRLHRRLRGLRRHRRPAGLAARRLRSTATRPTTAPRCCCPDGLPAARGRPRQRGHRAGHGRRRPAAGATPNKAVVAGDVRANENIALTATHTLFAREHNRIVAALPTSLSQEDKFQIARRDRRSPSSSTSPTTSSCPAMGVTPARRTAATTPTVNATLSNEFATVGYRAHSQIHGEFESTPTPAATRRRRSTRSRRRASRSTDGRRRDRARRPAERGVLQPRPARRRSSSARCCRASAASREYNNDEKIDNQLRSVLFQVPVLAATRTAWTARRCRSASTASSTSARSTSQRGRDHGMPRYNQLRKAYGLPAKTSFTAITGESTDAFPADPLLTRQRDQRPEQPRLHRRCSTSTATPIDRSRATRPTPTGRGVRRTTLAARLKAIYGTRRQPGRVHRHGRRAARARLRVRRAAAGHLEAAVRGAARRRPVLLRQRPAAGLSGPDRARPTSGRSRR